MRQSPTKVNFHYQNSHQQKYSPTFVHAGFVVGQPVVYKNVYENSVQLNHQRSRTYTSMPLNSSAYSNYQAPQPSKFAMPLRHSVKRMPQNKKVVQIEQYNSLLQKHIELQRKYWQLQQRYKQMLLQKRQISSEWIQNLIQRCKQNTIKEAMLLVDRTRLTYKQQQLNNI